jgi:hypothetical protein
VEVEVVVVYSQHSLNSPNQFNSPNQLLELFNRNHKE